MISQPLPDEIFIVMTERFTGEDYNGHENYEFKYEPGYDPGFFTSEEDAQDWIDKRHAAQRARYDAKMAEYEALMPEYESRAAIYSEAWKQHVEAMENIGANPGWRSPPPAPRKPRESDYLTKYAIETITREDA